MIGPVVLGTALLYLLISIAVVRWASRFARNNGRSAKHWGWGAVLVMYLIPFWDWIPTVATHQFYCAKDAGFWVYKTLEEWKSENPGVIGNLTTHRVWQHDYSGGKDIVHINQRFNLIYEKEGELFLRRWKWQRELLDTKTNMVLARYVDFSTGNGNIGGEAEFRFWLHSDYCIAGRDNAIRFSKFIDQFKGVEK